MADGGLDVPSKKIVLDVGRASFYLKIAILGLIIVCLGVGAGAVEVVNSSTDWVWAWTVSAFLLPPKENPKKTKLFFLLRWGGLVGEGGCKV